MAIAQCEKCVIGAQLTGTITGCRDLVGWQNDDKESKLKKQRGTVSN
jgi:hypothetical protein